MRRLLFATIVLFSSHTIWAQTDSATLSGRITDPQGRAVIGAQVYVTDTNTNLTAATKTNDTGIFVFPGLQPGPYRLMVRASGFASVIREGLHLHVQDRVEQNMSLHVGSIDQTVTVTAESPLINTEDGTVSTVVDRNFAENLPMNGRSFQSLIQLTPGVVVTASNSYDSGQFSIDGQRASSNYWTVDGVSANIGVGATTPGDGLAGAQGGFSAQGGTNSLVSVDALEEFRIQTSTYAPEFGRTPGGQISIVTRPGTNQFHGTAFDYLRNDVLDANDWFADQNGLPKPEERQNDFGGTLGGPIRRDRTFFFFSYEGLRLRLPEVLETEVPSITARQNANAQLAPYLKAYPLPAIQAIDNNGISPVSMSFSDRSALNATSLRVDHKVNDKLLLFGRYNYSPSEIIQRGVQLSSLSTITPFKVNTQTITVGATLNPSSVFLNDMRFNYSAVNGSSRSYMDGLGGAIPLSSPPFPAPFNTQNGTFFFRVLALGLNGGLRDGVGTKTQQRQLNFVDTMALQHRTHALKFGIDFRRLSPYVNYASYSQTADFLDVPSAQAGNLLFGFVNSSRSGTLLFRNLSLFSQDTWRASNRVTLTYGLRWDLDFAPSTLDGPTLVAVTGFDLSNLSNLNLAPTGTAPFKTRYGNVAPRIGIAYQLFRNNQWRTVLRGGYGIFYDLATSQVGASVSFTDYPFGASNLVTGTFPLSPPASSPPPIIPSNLAGGVLYAFDPNLKLPYAMQWNAAIEQELGAAQTISLSYLGSSGRRLLQSAYILSPNPSFGAADLVGNSASSSYDALQLQYQHRLLRGLQALASYTWSHSIDDASAGSYDNAANTAIPGVNSNANRGPSDFDIRNAFSAALTYQIPSPSKALLLKAVLSEWSVDNIVQARSAPPVNISDPNFFTLSGGYTAVRPDVVSNVPLYLVSSQFPGHKSLNPAAFVDPPSDQNGNPLRQGNLGRNALRAFGATQWDFAVHRNFLIRESMRLQFRAELFNILNHPNFGLPDSLLGDPLFGQAAQMLGRSLSGAGLGSNLGGGAFDPLYQIGGPRSIQLALKLMF